MEVMDRQKVKISVRNLVEFILRSGDIDNRIAAQDKDAMQMGAKLHRKIQKRMGASYHPEVTLRRVVEPQPPEEMMDLPGMRDEMRRPMMLLVAASKGNI